MLPVADGDAREQRLANYTRGYVGGTWNNDARTLGARATVGFGYAPEWDDRASPRFIGQYGPAGGHASLAAAAKVAPTTTVRATGSYAFTELHEFVTTTSNDRVFSYHDLGGTLRLESSQLFGAPVSLLVQGDITRSRKVSAIQLTAMDIAEDERILTSSHALVQLDASMAGGRNVLTVGGETSYSNADFNYVGISPSSFYVAGFLQNETRILRDPALLLNVGLRLERVENSDDAVPELRRPAATYTYPSISPRASLILRPTRGHSLRISGSTGTRLPQVFENFATAQVGMFEPPYFTLVPNPSVEPETVRSLELGYRGKPADALSLDAVVFFQQLRDLVAIRRTQIPVSYENAFDLDQLGLELGARFSVKKRLSGHVSYAFTKTLDDDSDELVPEHVLSIGAEVKLGETALGADFYYTAPFSPTFVTFLNQRAVEDVERVAPQLNLSARLTHHLSRRAEIFVYGTNLLATTRDLDDLRQYATDFAYPIGTTVVVGARLTPEKLP
jgi:outer membrane receptor protein involved in Fe transport